MMQVYLVVLVFKPTQKQVYDDAAVPTIIGEGAHAVIADSEAQAAAKAMRFLPDELKAQEDRVEVSVLPFRRAGA